MIQYITFMKNNMKFTNKEITTNDLGSPHSLDEFEINVIDLSDENIWRNNDNNTKSVNYKDDFIDLSTMIKNSKKTKIVIVLPQDCNFQYNKYYNNPTHKYEYYSKKNLKNMLDDLQTIINFIVDFKSIWLNFENTRTKIENFEILSSFYFTTSFGDILSYSMNSNKKTTIMIKDICMTTLNIATEEQLFSFLKSVGLIVDKEEAPEWVRQLEMFDDKQQKHIIEEKKEIISSAYSDIDKAKLILEKNDEYKSILYTNGTQLVHTVFDILQQILDYDLSGFVDEKKEDFLIRLMDITFLGEIKGVTSNVKSEHVAQLDVHYNGYLDKLNENNESEKVKSILIINHQRNKELDNRESVHEIQISLAERNESLIIETITLLRLYEKFSNGDITTVEVIDIFKDKVGLLVL